MSAYPHGPQRAPRLVDVLIKSAVGQRRAPRSENRRRIGNVPSLMFQQVREGRKQNGGTRVYGSSGRHGSQPILESPKLGAKDCDPAFPPRRISSTDPLLEPEIHVHLAVHRHRGG